MAGEIIGGRNAVSFNRAETVGVMPSDYHRTNETRTATFDPRYLKLWARCVEEAYGEDSAVEIIFTPGKPMVAVKSTTDTVRCGIGVAPRMSREEYEEMKEDDDGD